MIWKARVYCLWNGDEIDLGPFYTAGEAQSGVERILPDWVLDTLHPVTWRRNTLCTRNGNYNLAEVWEAEGEMPEEEARPTEAQRLDGGFTVGVAPNNVVTEALTDRLRRYIRDVGVQQDFRGVR